MKSHHILALFVAGILAVSLGGYEVMHTTQAGAACVLVACW